MQHLLTNIDGGVIPQQYFDACIETAIADAIVKDHPFNLDTLALFVRRRNQQLNLAEIRRRMAMLAPSLSLEHRLQQWLQIIK